MSVDASRIKAIDAMLPRTLAGRMETLDEWLAGPVLDNGERGAPLIDLETYLKLVHLPDAGER